MSAAIVDPPVDLLSSPKNRIAETRMALGRIGFPLGDPMERKRDGTTITATVTRTDWRCAMNLLVSNLSDASARHRPTSVPRDLHSWLDDPLSRGTATQHRRNRARTAPRMGLRSLDDSRTPVRSLWLTHATQVHATRLARVCIYIYIYIYIYKAQDGSMCPR